MPPGRHFLQIPGPTNVPERISRALSRSTIDHRGPEFARLTGNILERLGQVFQTEGPVIIYPSSATGAWEAALVNTLSPGDTVLFCANGHFASRWCAVAKGVGIAVETIEGDWRYPVDPAAVEARLAEDRHRTIRAVGLVHNETSTGVANDVAAVRAAIDRAGHNALLMVDTVSSLASMDYRHDEWGVDITVAGSQKGLMLPPGLGFNAISARARAAAARARLPKAYWGWEPILDLNQRGVFPYTPATNLLYGLDVALDMLLTEGLEQVFIRHRALAEATRRAVRAWGLQIFCRDQRAYSQSLTAVEMPPGCEIRKVRPLNRKLATLDAWVVGLRRSQSSGREGTDTVSLDHDHGGIVKVSPLAHWSDDQVWDYIKRNDVPMHKLYDQGYPSIGCAPCTRPTKPGESPRAGRWWWEENADKECGIHFSPDGSVRSSFDVLLEEVLPAAPRAR